MLSSNGHAAKLAMLEIKSKARWDDSAGHGSFHRQASAAHTTPATAERSMPAVAASMLAIAILLAIGVAPHSISVPSAAAYTRRIWRRCRLVPSPMEFWRVAQKGPRSLR